MYPTIDQSVITNCRDTGRLDEGLKLVNGLLSGIILLCETLAKLSNLHLSAQTDIIIIFLQLANESLPCLVLPIVPALDLHHFLLSVPELSVHLPIALGEVSDSGLGVSLLLLIQ